jgi:nitrogen regulatory protein P-II 1
MNMKRVEAIVRPENLESLREALDAKGFHGMTVTEVKGRGTQKGITLEWRVGEYKVEFLPKIKLELVINDKDLDGVIRIITEVCHTGNIGDGKIFVIPIEEIIKIRTGQRGPSAV